MPANSRKGPIRYAVVGAGWFGQEAILPAFALAERNSRLAAIVSGDRDKRAVLSKKYQVPAFDYDDYEKLLASGDVDAVFIATPNTVHRPNALAAARHGVHVLCEKPLAESARAAKDIVTACDEAGVKLMTAYRLHFEKANLTAMELANDGTIGSQRLFTAANVQMVEAGNTRLDASLGGHPLLDLGIYCVNAARYLFREEPEEVSGFTASGPDPRFREVPEMTTGLLRFPGERLALIACGFGESKVSTYQIIGTRGDLRLESAFSFTGEISMELTVEGKTTRRTFPDRGQISPEILYFSDCILNDNRPEPDGHEGWIDLRIMDAILTSAEQGKAVKLKGIDDVAYPGKDQEINKPQVNKPDLVNAAPPQPR